MSYTLRLAEDCAKLFDDDDECVWLSDEDDEFDYGPDTPEPEIIRHLVNADVIEFEGEISQVIDERGEADDEDEDDEESDDEDSDEDDEGESDED